jgi:hypothetical protein
MAAADAKRALIPTPALIDRPGRGIRVAALPLEQQGPANQPRGCFTKL